MAGEEKRKFYQNNPKRPVISAQDQHKFDDLRESWRELYQEKGETFIDQDPWRGI